MKCGVSRTRVFVSNTQQVGSVPDQADSQCALTHLIVMFLGTRWGYERTYAPRVPHALKAYGFRDMFAFLFIFSLRKGR